MTTQATSRSPEKSTTVRSFALTATQTAFRGLGRVAPGLAVRTAAQLFFKTRRFPSKPGETDALVDAAPGRLELHGRSLAAWVWPARGEERGSVLLVHGWNGRATQLGGFVAPLREAGYRVVAFDNVGHGRSAGASADLVSLAEGLLAVNAAYGPFDGIVAHSLGGPATTLALVAGLETDRVVLIASPFSAGNAISYFIEQVGLDRAFEPLLRKRIERRVGVRVDELSAAHLGPFVKPPVLVIHDRNDREIPHENGVRLAWSFPDARLRSTDGLGHQRILRDADVIDHAVSFITAEQIATQEMRGVS